jgi:hypothetical protein
MESEFCPPGKPGEHGFVRGTSVRQVRLRRVHRRLREAKSRREHPESTASLAIGFNVKRNCREQC